MLTQEKRISLPEFAGLNRMKWELNQLPSVDAGDYIVELPPDERAIAFRLLNKSKATDVFEYLPPEIQEDLISSLHATDVRQLVDSMRPDDRAELFDELPARIVKRLLDQLSPIERQATATILGYPEGTTGRMMTTEFVQLRQGLTIGEALEKIRRSDYDKESIYYAYVVDEQRQLVQVISLRQLLFSIPTVLVGEVASDRVVKAHTEMPQEQAAQLMKRYDLIALPVVDRENRLVGIVTIDDIVDILEEEATEDIQKIAGVSGGDEAALSPPTVTIRKRLPWLLGNIALYVGAASAIAPFQSVIALVPVLAVVMPILSNTSGNVAIQALSVTVRGLGIGEVTHADTFKILRKEVLAGLATAVVLGFTLAGLSLIWAAPSERWVSIIAGLVMVINVLVAASLGTLLPMVLKRLSLDPALISGPLLTTTLDAVGFMTFLSLISVAMHWFG
ncbi:MAG: magnesium transporter [Elainellaceae cyanobacterium]